ncbi:MAG TPA: response regulator transcription factor [Polyangiaceae bacterium]|jgi:DNA-binding response OmpR family regulator|nr:response regulator transcription factor [Polyangiaceae bacterium]
MLSVLVVDDDERLYELLRSYFEQNGIGSAHAADGRRALAMLEQMPCDAVLLDIMMPGPDGLSVLKKIREKSRVPVIMLTAKGDETDRVVGLELGADDYLTKPFSPRELLARLKAVLRRAQPELEQERLSVGSLLLELGSRQVQLAGRAVEVTGLEFDLLSALMRRPGQVVPRTRLLELAGRGDTLVNDRTVDVHISHLRKKLGDDPPRLIKTVRGVGYVLSKE